MNNKKLITICIAIIAIAIIVCGIINVYNANEIQKELNKPIVFNNTIEGVGTFQSINTTNFTISNSSNDQQTDYKANDTITQITTTSSSSAVEITKSEAEKVNDTPKGHTIYKNTANIGEHKGEVRYFTILKDNDNQRYIMISSGNYNLTAKIVDTFKFLEPVTKQEVKNTDKITEDTSTSNSQSNSEEMVRWNGGYAEKGKVDIIKKYGMGPESEQKMKEAGY